MSKSITARDFAQKMIEWYEDQSSTDSTAQAADLAADIGLALAPEKPEPGTRGVVAEGPRKGYLAVVQQNGALLMFNEHGDCYRREPDEDWPALTPARVVPAESVELSEEEVGEVWDETVEATGYTLNFWGAIGTELRTIAVHASRSALAKHGTGRVEVTRDEVYGAIASQWEMVNGITEAADRVMELLEGSK